MKDNNSITDEDGIKEDNSIFNNNIFLVFLSAGISLLIAGAIFIGYYMYYYKDRPITIQVKTPVVETTDTKTDIDWKSSEMKPANKVKSGVVNINGKLDLTINSITLTSERNWDIEKSYGQVALVNYTYKNLGVTTGLEITADDIEIRDRKGYRVDTYSLDSLSPDYRILQPNEECTVTYPIAIVNASEDLRILVKTRDGELKSWKTLVLHMD